MKNIVVREVLGADCHPEDAIILKQIIEENWSEKVVLDFQQVEQVPCTFFSNLLTDLMDTKGRESIAEHVDVKNLSNEKSFKRVFQGTAF